MKTQITNHFVINVPMLFQFLFNLVQGCATFCLLPTAKHPKMHPRPPLVGSFFTNLRFKPYNTHVKQQKKLNFQIWRIYSIINYENARSEKKKKKYILATARFKRNMLDFNFKKSMSKKLLNIFCCCYFATEIKREQRELSIALIAD